MKTLIYLSAIAVVATLTSCKSNKTTEIDDPTAVPIHLNANVSTKATVDGTTFPANTTNVFYITAFANTTTPTDFTTAHFSSEAVNSGTQSKLAFATEQFYHTDRTQKLYFYAYTPAATTYNAGNGATAPTIDYTLTGQQDIMTASHTVGISKKEAKEGQSPDFTFTHQMKRLKFKIIAGAEYPIGQQLRSLTIVNTKTGAQVDLITGLTSFSGTGDITAYQNATGIDITQTESAEFGAVMLAPNAEYDIKLTTAKVGETVASGEPTGHIKLTYQTGTNAGTPDADAGVSHTITLKINPSQIQVNASITEWKIGGNQELPIL